uniref:Uncharacterized protein n=1 Tax=Lygus hesperus TaxID=30085 RepID=A0A146M7V0_LYGHE
MLCILVGTETAGDGDRSAMEAKFSTLTTPAVSSYTGIESGPSCGIILVSTGVTVVFRHEKRDGGSEGIVPAFPTGAPTSAGDGVFIKSVLGAAYDSRCCRCSTADPLH